MIIRENAESKRLLEAMNDLKLTEKNQAIWEKYMDLSIPEEQEMLKEVEHQDFTELDGSTRRQLYNFTEYLRQKNKKLCDRYIRFVAEVGGSTAKYTLFRYIYNNVLGYLEEVLPIIPYAAIRSEHVAWDRHLFKESEYHFLVEIGQEHPDWIEQMVDLCYDDDACNTHMFLAGVYLYCVKPLEDSHGYICLPRQEDKRATDNRERILEMTDYLEKRLMGNIDGLFIEKDEPKDEDLEKLKAFVREGDPNDPIPVEVRAIISNRTRHEYRMTFLPFLAFLGLEHSNKFIQLIRLAVLINGDLMPNFPLDGCLGTGATWFPEHIKALEPYLPIEPKDYIRWCIDRKEEAIINRIIEKTPEVIKETFGQLSLDACGFLIKVIKDQNPALYQQFGAQLQKQYRQTAAKEEAQRYKIYQDEIASYLLGESELSALLPLVEEIRERGNARWLDNKRVNSYLDSGEEQLYRRTLVLECLRLSRAYYYTYWVDPSLKSYHTVDYKNRQDDLQVEGLLSLFEAEQVPASYQLEYLGMDYDSSAEQSACSPDSCSQQCVVTLKRIRSQWHQEWIDASKSKDLLTRIIGIRVMAEDAETYKAELLDCVGESSKQAKGFLLLIYKKHPEWEAEFLQMLQSKKATEREMAVRVLAAWGADKYKESLQQVMETEKTKKVKTLLQEILEVSAEGGEGAKEKTSEDKVKDILLGGRKRKLAWFLTDDLPKVHQEDGSEASEDYLAAILISYADMAILGVNEDAKELAKKLNAGELAAYVRILYDRWLADGAQAKKKWVLYAASIHGGDTIVPVLSTQIQEWPKNARSAIAAEAVKALALNGTSTALLAVDQLARKCKFRQVKGAAAAALDFAAEQLGISREELEDRIVPNLGFDSNNEQMFDYGTRTFRVVLTSSLTLEVYDEKGKMLKNMPAPGKQDDPVKAKAANDAWKLLKKQLKTVTSNQKVRLEQIFITERKWTGSQWQELFVKNPVMHPFAMGLIWGVYKEEKLIDTFRYMEDGTFNTAEEEEYELAEDAVVGLVHPIELSEESLQTWEEQLSDYEVVQPIEQLKRPVYRVTEEEKEEKDLIRFGGMVINGLSLSGKLQNLGWYKGEVEDAGLYYEFYRYDKDISVQLEFSGCYVDYSNEEVVVYEAYFYRPGNLKKDGLQYILVREVLGDVNPRYFSEVVLQLTQATAASKERRPYPECRNR